jgi:hypothetical protein
MKVIISGFDFWNMEAEKYWAPTKNINLKELVNNAIFSGDYIGSRKVDGQWDMMIKDEEGNLYLRPRNESVNGGYPNKIDWVPHLKEAFNSLPNGTVLLGEIYFNGNEGSRKVTTIMGCLKEKAVQRQEKGDKLSFYIFDILAYDKILTKDWPLESRISEMIALSKWFKNPYIKYAEFYKGEELLDYIAYCREQGWEGVVLQRKDGIYEPGKRPARKSIKVKKELDKEVDCFLTGNYKDATWEYTGKEVGNWKYWFDLKNNQKKEGIFYEDFQNGAPIEPISKGAFFGWAGSVEIGVVKGEEIIPIGWISNVTEEVKRGIVEDNSSWARRVVKINAMMMESDTHNFRHARIIEWRNPEDMSWRDCTFEKVLGEEK